MFRLLQIDIVKRLIERYSNKGELVYDPFCGLGTVPYCALEMGRRGQGSELKSRLFHGPRRITWKSMEQKVNLRKLFDFDAVGVTSETGIHLADVVCVATGAGSSSAQGRGSDVSAVAAASSTGMYVSLDGAHLNRAPSPRS